MAETYQRQRVSEMHQRDLLGKRQGKGIHLERVKVSFHGILPHMEDATGNDLYGNRISMAVRKSSVGGQIGSSISYPRQKNITNILKVTKVSGGAPI